jgi:hypothetical protein
MTKEFLSPNVEGRSGCKISGAVIRISVFLRISSFVIRIWEARFMGSVAFRFILKVTKNQTAVIPPSATSTWPVTNDASSDAR